MELKTTERNFHVIENNAYPEHKQIQRLIQESSAIGSYHDAFDKPGSSYLWVGDNQHLCREEVTELISYMQRWLDTGCLSGNQRGDKENAQNN